MAHFTRSTLPRFTLGALAAAVAVASVVMLLIAQEESSAPGEGSYRKIANLGGRVTATETYRSIDFRNAPLTDEQLLALLEEPESGAFLRAASRLDLEGTNVSARGVSYLLKCDRLMHLSLRACRIGDEAACLLAELRSLRSLDVSKTRLTDEGLACLSDLPNLEMLDLSECPVTAKGGDAAIRRSRTLKHIRLAGTGMTAAEVQAMRGASPSLVIRYSDE